LQVETQYHEDLASYEKAFTYSAENSETKAAVDMLSKAHEAGELTGMIESGEISAFSTTGTPLGADEVKAAL